MREPVDTSQLGPVRVEPAQTALHAAQVRDALREAGSICEWRDRSRFEELADYAPDEALTKLRRLIR